VNAGFDHSVACIMSAQSYWAGKKLYWDAKNETIVDHDDSVKGARTGANSGAG
jgi:hypothetical protein